MNQETIAHELIECPECLTIQAAQVVVYDQIGFPAYVHKCINCGYMITESEWQVVEREAEAEAESD